MKGKLDRKAVVEEVKRKLQDAQVIILTDFRGLNVHELGKLRNQLFLRCAESSISGSSNTEKKKNSKSKKPNRKPQR